MGDRALIQLIDDNGEFSPVLYLHWAGSSVRDILERAAKRMQGRPNDVPYAFARLVQAACDLTGPNSSLSIGAWNASAILQAKDTHGDAGVFVANVTQKQWMVRTGGGYGFADDETGNTEALAHGSPLE